jgi:transcription termination/antitermination protein NusG
MNTDILKPEWYVIHTRSRFENVVNDGLLKKSFEVFLPKVQVPSKRRDRKLMIRVPVFPGYLFVKTDLSAREHLDIVKTVGAVRLVGTKNGPVSVPDDTVASLKIMVESNRHITTGKRMLKGDKVLVVRGPFTGVRGTFCNYRGKGRILINVDALGQTAGVEVNQDDIELLPKILA